MRGFIPKCHVLPVRPCVISGSRSVVAFVAELGAAMIVASTIVPASRSSRFSVSSPLIASNIAPFESWLEVRMIVGGRSARIPWDALAGPMSRLEGRCAAARDLSEHDSATSDAA